MESIIQNENIKIDSVKSEKESIFFLDKNRRVFETRIRNNKAKKDMKNENKIVIKS